MGKARPVETGHAFVTVALAAVAHHDVVAALTVHTVGDAIAEKHVVAEHRIGSKGIEVVAGGAVGHAELEPVVALVAERKFIGYATEDEVVSPSAERL